MNRPRQILATLGLALCAAAASCAEDQTSRPSAGLVGMSSLPMAEDMAAPVVVAGENGLEARVWMVEDGDGAAGKALGKWAKDVGPIDAEVAARWRRSGLRIVRVPLDEIAGVMTVLPVSGRIERKWLGQPVEWMELFDAGMRSGAGVFVDGGLVTTGPGRLRMLCRAWTAPTANGPALRVDLALQHAAAQSRTAFEAPVRHPLVEEGLVFSAVSLDAALPGGFAYLIIPEAPDAEWGEAGEHGAEAQGPPARAMSELGPPLARAQTVGESLLVVRSDPVATVTTKTVIMLIPRTPKEFRLLP